MGLDPQTDHHCQVGEEEWNEDLMDAQVTDRAIAMLNNEMNESPSPRKPGLEYCTTQICIKGGHCCILLVSNHWNVLAFSEIMDGISFQANRRGIEVKVGLKRTLKVKKLIFKI